MRLLDLFCGAGGAAKGYADAGFEVVGVYGKHPDGRLLYRRKDGSEQHAAASVEEGREAMGIDWMDWDELREAIPPAYTRFLGEQLMIHLNARAAA